MRRHPVYWAPSCIPYASPSHADLRGASVLNCTASVMANFYNRPSILSNPSLPSWFHLAWHTIRLADISTAFLHETSCPLPGLNYDFLPEPCIACPLSPPNLGVLWCSRQPGWLLFLNHFSWQGRYHFLILFFASWCNPRWIKTSPFNSKFIHDP